MFLATSLKLTSYPHFLLQFHHNFPTADLTGIVDSWGTVEKNFEFQFTHGWNEVKMQR